MNYKSSSGTTAICGAAVLVKVYLVGRPQFDVEAFLAFLAEAQTNWRRTPAVGEAEELTEAAGRVCYMSFGTTQSPRSNFDYLRNLITMGHESVLEHVTWSFVVSGISRALSHQLVRHRVGFAFSQLSQQYHDESDAEFVRPSDIEGHPRAEAAWERAVDAAKDAYFEIRQALEEEANERGVGANQRETKRAIRSAARSVLPNCTKTVVFMTVNARALRYFFDVRGGIPGDREMRELAVELFALVNREAPALFCDFEVGTFPDGSRMVRRSGSTR